MQALNIRNSMAQKEKTYSYAWYFIIDVLLMYFLHRSDRPAAK